MGSTPFNIFIHTKTWANSCPAGQTIFCPGKFRTKIFLSGQCPTCPVGQKLVRAARILNNAYISAFLHENMLRYNFHLRHTYYLTIF